MKLIRSLLLSLPLFCMVLLGNSVVAAEKSLPDAHQTIRETTDRVLTAAKAADEYYSTDPQRFYLEVEKILNDAIDFNGFAQGVMGVYGSKKQYSQLKTAEEKAEFKARIKRFAGIFKDGLIQTYAKGILTFGGERIEVTPPKESNEGKRSVTVVQKIYGEADKPYTVLYKMRVNKKGAWKIRNVTIEAVNLGKVYRGQFSSAAKQYKGDIDKVIDNWTVEPEKDEVAKTEAS